MEKTSVMISVDISQEPKIAFNSSQIKKCIHEISEMHKGLQYTEGQYADLKKDLAKLRKIEKDLTSQTSYVKKKYMEPFDNFKKEMDEIRSELGNTIKDLSAQGDEFEKQRKEKKLAEIKSLYQELCTNAQVEIPFSKVFQDKWLNVSTTKASIKKSVKSFLCAYQQDIESIENSCKYYEQAKKVYLETFDLNAALKENNELLRQEQVIEEKKKEEEAVKKLAEQSFFEDSERSRKNDLPSQASGMEMVPDFMVPRQKQMVPDFMVPRQKQMLETSSNNSNRASGMEMVPGFGVSRQKQKSKASLNNSNKVKVVFELEMDVTKVPEFLGFLEKEKISFRKIN